VGEVKANPYNWASYFETFQKLIKSAFSFVWLEILKCIIVLETIPDFADSL